MLYSIGNQNIVSQRTLLPLALSFTLLKKRLPGVVLCPHSTNGLTKKKR